MNMNPLWAVIGIDTYDKKVFPGKTSLVNHIYLNTI